MKIGTSSLAKRPNEEFGIQYSPLMIGPAKPRTHGVKLVNIVVPIPTFSENCSPRLMGVAHPSRHGEEAVRQIPIIAAGEALDVGKAGREVRTDIEGDRTELEVTDHAGGGEAYLSAHRNGGWSGGEGEDQKGQKEKTGDNSFHGKAPSRESEPEYRRFAPTTIVEALTIGRLGGIVQIRLYQILLIAIE
jgi:hypothetical protein